MRTTAMQRIVREVVGASELSDCGMYKVELPTQYVTGEALRCETVDALVDELRKVQLDLVRELDARIASLKALQEGKLVA